MAANWQLVDDQRSDGVWLSGGNLELAGRAPVKSFCGHVATAKRERGSYGLRREVRMAGSHRGTSVCVCVRDFQCQPKHSAAFADRVDSPRFRRKGLRPHTGPGRAGRDGGR